MKVRVFVNFAESGVLVTYERKVSNEVSKEIIKKLREKFNKPIYLVSKPQRPFKIFTIEIKEA